MKTVIVKAIDWTKYSNTWDSDFPFSLKEAVIAGILLDETDGYLTIAQVKFSTGEVRDVLVIPKCCVLDKKEFDYELGENLC